MILSFTPRTSDQISDRLLSPASQTVAIGGPQGESADVSTTRWKLAFVSSPLTLPRTYAPTDPLSASSSAPLGLQEHLLDPRRPCFRYNQPRETPRPHRPKRRHARLDRRRARKHLGCRTIQSRCRWNWGRRERGGVAFLDEDASSLFRMFSFLLFSFLSRLGRLRSKRATD